MTYSEAGRDLEITDDESGFDSDDSVACKSESVVEALPFARLPFWNGESRHGLGLVLTQPQKLLRPLHFTFVVWIHLSQDSLRPLENQRRNVKSMLLDRK